MYFPLQICGVNFHIFFCTWYLLPYMTKDVWVGLNIKQLMNEAGYLMNTLRDLHDSSYDTKAGFNNCFIIHSK